MSWSSHPFVNDSTTLAKSLFRHIRGEGKADARMHRQNKSATKRDDPQPGARSGVGALPMWRLGVVGLALLAALLAEPAASSGKQKPTLPRAAFCNVIECWAAIC